MRHMQMHYSAGRWSTARLTPPPSLQAGRRTTSATVESPPDRHCEAPVRPQRAEAISRAWQWYPAEPSTDVGSRRRDRLRASPLEYRNDGIVWLLARLGPREVYRRSPATRAARPRACDTHQRPAPLRLWGQLPPSKNRLKYPARTGFSCRPNPLRRAHAISRAASDSYDGVDRPTRSSSRPDGLSDQADPQRRADAADRVEPRLRVGAESLV